MSKYRANVNITLFDDRDQSKSFITSNLKNTFSISAVDGIKPSFNEMHFKKAYEVEAADGEAAKKKIIDKVYEEFDSNIDIVMGATLIQDLKVIANDEEINKKKPVYQVPIEIDLELNAEKYYAGNTIFSDELNKFIRSKTYASNIAGADKDVIVPLDKPFIEAIDGKVTITLIYKIEAKGMDEAIHKAQEQTKTLFASNELFKFKAFRTQYHLILKNGVLLI